MEVFKKLIYFGLWVGSAILSSGSLSQTAYAASNFRKQYDFENGSHLIFIKENGSSSDRIEFQSHGSSSKRTLLKGSPKIIPTSSEQEGSYSRNQNIYFHDFSQRAGWPKNTVLVGAGDRFYLINDQGSVNDLRGSGFSNMSAQHQTTYLNIPSVGFEDQTYFLVQITTPGDPSGHCFTDIIRSDGQRRLVS